MLKKRLKALNPARFELSSMDFYTSAEEPTNTLFYRQTVILSSSIWQHCFLACYAAVPIFQHYSWPRELCEDSSQILTVQS